MVLDGAFADYDEARGLGAAVLLGGTFIGPDGTEGPGLLASSSIDNASGSSSSRVLGVASAGASARPDGTGRPGVLTSSSIGNTPGSPSDVLDGAFEDEKEGRRNGAAVALGGAFAGPDGTGRTGVLASSSIDNTSGSSLKGGVLGVASAGASARTDGTGSPEVLTSSSIDNTSGSLSEALDGDFEEEKAGRRNGATVALGGEFAGPDGTGRTAVLASSSIDNASGSSSTLNSGVLGVDLEGASARPDGTGQTEVLPSSSIDNASESSSVVFDSDFRDQFHSSQVN